MLPGSSSAATRPPGGSSAPPAGVEGEPSCQRRVGTPTCQAAGSQSPALTVGGVQGMARGGAFTPHPSPPPCSWAGPLVSRASLPDQAGGVGELPYPRPHCLSALVQLGYSTGPGLTSPPLFSMPARNMVEPRKRHMQRCRCTVVREPWMGRTSRKVRMHSSRQTSDSASPTLVIRVSFRS